QRRCAEKLDATWHEMDTGHYPLLRAPDELVELIFVDCSAPSPERVTGLRASSRQHVRQS
ncbi:MAG: hypothetical protein ACR2PK_06840, partial [Acidimicrobiales bacterium]